ncbi:MAG: hypothetical protein ACRD22_11615, partial [Terriglobia bacterium]
PGTLVNVLNTDNNVVFTTNIILPPQGSANVLQVADCIVPPSGDAVTIQIASPVLLNVPLPFMWGPYPRLLIFFACGDKFNPGTLYLTNPNDPDSTSTANTIDLTSPDEILVNGVIFGNDSYVFTPDRMLILQPTFTQFEAGTGNFFQAEEIPGSRGYGLISPYLLCSGTSGIWWVSNDGIYQYAGGAIQNLTDATLYPLFTHGGFPPAAVTVCGQTINPPSSAQRLSFANGFLYYDFKDAGGNAHTLVYEVARQAWWYDSYAGPYPVVREAEANLSSMTDTSTSMILADDNGVLYSLGGVNDGTTTITPIVVTPAIVVGNGRSPALIGDAWLDAYSSGGNVTLTLWGNGGTTNLGSGTIALPTGRQQYLLGLGDGVQASNAALAIEFTAGEILYQWSPSVIAYPDSITTRATDLDDNGTAQAKYYTGCEITCATNNQNITIEIIADGNVNQGTFTLKMPQIKGVIPLAFSPFYAHVVQIVPTTNLDWQLFGVRWIAEPAPELAPQFTEWLDGGFKGSKYIRGLILDCDSAGVAVTIDTKIDQGGVGPTLTLTVSSRTQLEFAFTPFIAQVIQLQPQQPIRIFGIRLIFDQLPELSTEFQPWDDAQSPGPKYIRGLILDCDTQNAGITISIGVDQSASGPSFLATANGRTQLEIPFTPFIAQTLQLQPSASMRIFGAKWIFDPYPPLDTQFSPWTDAGFQGSKYIRGVVVDCDTQNLKVTIAIAIDQTVMGPSFQVQADGRSQIEIAFDSPFIAQTLQLQPQSSFRLFGVRWITDQYPELAPQFTTIQSLGGAKYIRGLILDADTQNLQIGVQILGDNQSLLTTITAWLNGHGEQAFAFN